LSGECWEVYIVFVDSVMFFGVLDDGLVCCVSVIDVDGDVDDIIYVDM